MRPSRLSWSSDTFAGIRASLDRAGFGLILPAADSPCRDAGLSSVDRFRETPGGDLFEMDRVIPIKVKCHGRQGQTTPVFAPKNQMAPSKASSRDERRNCMIGLPQSGGFARNRDPIVLLCEDPAEVLLEFRRPPQYEEEVGENIKDAKN